MVAAMAVKAAGAEVTMVAAVVVVEVPMEVLTVPEMAAALVPGDSDGSGDGEGGGRWWRRGVVLRATG